MANMNIPVFSTREKVMEDDYIHKREAEKAAAAKQNSGTAITTQSKTDQTQGSSGADKGAK
jgi:hypothetical protein